MENALTPVVLITSAAILASGIPQKHADVAGRIRTLMMELRKAALAEARRANLRAQIDVFRRRARFAQTAHLCLYLSIVPFVAMILAILFQAPRLAAEGLLITGVVLVLCAVLAEVLELSLAGRSIRLALEDDTPESQARP